MLNYKNNNWNLRIIFYLIFLTAILFLGLKLNREEALVEAQTTCFDIWQSRMICGAHFFGTSSPTYVNIPCVYQGISYDPINTINGCPGMFQRVGARLTEGGTSHGYWTCVKQ